MNPLKQYKIGFVGLSLGKHEFSFEIGPDFFQYLGEAAFDHGKVELRFILAKSNNMLELDFFFSGEVRLICDRCMEYFPHRVDLQRRLLVKFGEAYVEQSDEILIIPATESHIDISQYVYEFLHLGMPLRKVHPEEQDGLSQGCDPEVINRLQSYLGNNNENKNDSPWNILKSLNFKS